MKALILAGGYAVRLYPLTENQPKPLLQVGGKEIINHILSKLESVNEVKEVYIVTNDRFYPLFQQWKGNYVGSKNLHLINDGTKSNEDRLGAIGDLLLVLQQQQIKEDLLVIAGDNLFRFSLKDFVDFFHQRKSTIVAFHDMKEKDKIKGKYGAGVLEGTKLINFEEKPMNPSSTLASTACYLFAAQDLSLVQDLVRQGKADAPGHLIKWLMEKSIVHGFAFDEAWFDVGSLESLQEAEEVYEHEN